jgi:DNA-binding NarL/FixJ family response regulator
MDIANGDLAQDSFVSASPAQPVFEAHAAPTLPLSRIWAALRSGAAVVKGVEQNAERLYITLERRKPRMSTSRILRRRLDVLERLLLGDSGKVIAYDLDLSMSTIATDRIMACRALGLDAETSRKPMFLVMAVHAALGMIESVAQIHSASETQTLLSVERPDRQVGCRLTTTEFQVLVDIVDGFTHAEVAHRRGKSIRTIANQLASVFHKLRVSGKGSLLALLARESQGGRCRPRAPLSYERAPAYAIPWPKENERSAQWVQVSQPWGIGLG